VLSGALPPIGGPRDINTGDLTVVLPITGCNILVCLVVEVIWGLLGLLELNVCAQLTQVPVVGVFGCLGPSAVVGIVVGLPVGFVVGRLASRL
jgi:hypothetical protein